MRLSRHSDYAIRVLIHLGAAATPATSIAAIAEAFGISRFHLMKVVQGLVHGGFVAARRGRGGGLTLARDPGEIALGAVLRHTEATEAMVPCATCRIAPACTLPPLLGRAMAAFLAVLDQANLADLLADPQALLGLLQPTKPARGG